MSLPLSAVRVLQPKPAPNESPRLVGQGLPASKPRKRGRPSKADIEARKAEETVYDSASFSGTPAEYRYSGGLPVESQTRSQVTPAPIFADFAHRKSPDEGVQHLTGEASGKKKRGRPSSRKSIVSHDLLICFIHSSGFTSRDTAYHCEMIVV